MSSGIFLIDDGGALVEMPERPHARESDFQELLAVYPKLLAGDQLSPDSPLRWLLVRREAGIPATDSSGARWSVDHLFLDQDAVPTLVEVKRSSDTRLRREVVGQMLDYAANAVVYWPVTEVRAMFSAECDARGLDPDAVIGEFLGDEEDVEEYWGRVKTNLQAGRVRMMFVADSIPSELRRIVEFMNEQMDPAEVVAVEIKRYEGEGVAAVVPRLIGQTAESQRRKATGRPSKVWTEDLFFEALASSRDEADVRAARRIHAWCVAHGLRLDYGRGSNMGSISPKYLSESGANNLFSMWTHGGLALQFESLKTPFDDDHLKLELISKLNEVPGFNFGPDDMSRWPTRQISLLSRDGAFEAFTSAFEWMFSVIETSEVRD